MGILTRAFGGACLAAGLPAGTAHLSVDAGVQVNTFIPAQAFGANLLPYVPGSAYAAVQPKLRDSGAAFYVYPSGFTNDYHWSSSGSFDARGWWVPSATAYSPGFRARALHRGSTSNYGHPSVAGDGDPATYWLSHPDTDAPEAQWLYVDLGSPQAVDGAEIDWGPPHATRFSIQAWDPASSNQWAPYLHGTDDWLDSSAAAVVGTGGAQAVSFTALSSRYFRLLMTDSSASPAQYAVRELRFFNGALQVTRNNALLNGVQPDQTPMLSSSMDPACRRDGIPGFDFEAFMAYARGMDPPVEVMINVNFGGGTPQEAAAWVHYANVVRGYGIRHWSVGNEAHGYWEAGGPLSARDYARRYLDFYRAMKAADPSIIVGGPVTGDPYNATSNGYDGLNFIEGFLERLRDDPSGDQRGAMEALVFHWYPYITGSDAGPYFAGTERWARFAADLGGWLAGVPGAASLPLFNTEYNSNVSGGPFSTSRANGLWFAVNAGEFLTHLGERGHAAYWTVLHPNDAALNAAGGDQSWFQLEAGAQQYQERATAWAQGLLATEWSIPGDRRPHALLQAASDDASLRAYASLRPDGELTLLVANTDLDAARDASISLTGFNAAPEAAFLQMDASTYEWSSGSQPYHASPSLPPARSQVTVAGNAVQLRLNAGSLSVLRFRDASLPPASPTPRPSATPSPQPTATVCVRPFNACEHADENGTWTGNGGLRSWVGAAEAPPGALTEGAACLRVQLDGLGAWNDQILNLESFNPASWEGIAALRLDAYVDPAVLSGAGYAHFELWADASPGAYYKRLSLDRPALAAGANRDLTFRLDWGGGLDPAEPLTRLMLVLSTNATGQGSLYLDHLRLLDACGLPPPGPTMTPTPMPSASPTPLPSAEPSGPPDIRALVPVPNPNPRTLAVEMGGPASTSTLSLFSLALNRVWSRDTGPLRGGWNRLPLDPAWMQDLAAGIYLLRLQTARDGEEPRRALAKLMLLR